MRRSHQLPAASKTPLAVLERAIAAGLADVVIIGKRQDGTFYTDTTEYDGATVNWWLDIAKATIIEAGR